MHMYIKKFMDNNKTIVVTGGAGYIGSHTIIEIIENTDFDVVSVDNFSNSSAKTFDRIELITGKKVKNYNINLCDKEAFSNVLSSIPNCIGVIHFAAFKSVPESVDNPYLYYHNNIESLLNTLEGCLEFDVPNFIFSSSCSVYGNISSLPVNESTPFSVAESPYAYTKQVGETIIKDYAKRFDKLKTISLRYFNPVGAHSSGLIGESPINPPTSLLPIITQTAIGLRGKMFVHGTDYDTRDGSCVRDYIHVSDIAKAHVTALFYLIDKKNEEVNTIFNLGTGDGVSVKEAINVFEEVTNKKLNYEFGPRREGDVEAIYSDTTKSKNQLGWEAKRGITEMVNSAWNWQLKLKEESSDS